MRSGEIPAGLAHLIVFALVEFVVGKSEAVVQNPDGLIDLANLHQVSSSGEAA